jgi:hypothetical protein
MLVSLHPFDVQVLQHDHRLGFRQVTRELVEMILPKAGDSVVQAGEFELRILTVARSFLAARKLSVQSREFL